MNEKRITTVSDEEAERMEDRTDLERVRRLTDEEITAAAKDDPDTFIPDAQWWKDARVVSPRLRKRQVTLRLDQDVLDWFRDQGKGYQSKINAVLRSFVEAHRNDR